MRKFIGLAVVAAFLWVAAGPAEALNLPLGDLEIDFNDWSSFFHAGAPIGGGVPGPATPAIGDELRAIFRAGTIHSLTTGENVNASDFGQELTGLLYDLVVGPGMLLVGPGSVTIGLVPGVRYADTTVPGSGGRIDVWLDSTLPGSQPLGSNGAAPVFQDPNAPTGDGPSEWVVGPGGLFPAHDDFPGVSDITVGGAADAGAKAWLSGVLVPMPPGVPLSAGFINPFPGAVYVISVSTITATGSAFGFIDVIFNGTGLQILDDAQKGGVPALAGADLSIQSILGFSSSVTRSLNGWDALSDDPILMTTFVPEPASMSLLLVGLFGGAGAYWRRRRAA